MPLSRLVASVDELRQLLDELRQLITELGTRVGHVVDLDLEGGNVIEASTKISKQLLAVDAKLNAGVIAPIAIMASSAVNLSALIPSVIGIAKVDRAPSTTMSAPRKVHRA